MAIEVTVVDAEMYGDRLWFSNASLNGLFSMDINNFEIRFELFFPGVDLNKRLIHRWVFPYGNKLYFIPFTGQAIHIFDGEKITSIPIEKMNKNANYMFSNAVFSEEEKRIYLIPMDNDSDLQYLDLQSNCINNIPSFKRCISKLDSNTAAEFQIWSTYLLDGELCFLYGNKWFVKWDITQESMEIYKVAPNSDNMAYDLLFDKRRLWLYFQNGDLAVLDGTNYSKFDIQFNTRLEKEHTLDCVIEQAGYTWFISDKVQMLFKYKDNGKTIERLFLKETLQRSNIGPGYTESGCAKHIRDTLYIFNPSIKGIIQIGDDGNIRQIISNFYSDDIRVLYCKKIFAEKNDIAMENDIGLPGFLEFVCQREFI